MALDIGQLEEAIDGLQQNISQAIGNGTHTGVAKQVKAIAEHTGEDVNKIRVVDPQWARLLADGYIVDLDVCGWPAESTASVDDLGIEFNSEQERRAWAQMIRPGQVYLLPEDERQAIARAKNKARRVLKQYAHETHYGFFLYEGQADPSRGRDAGWLYREWKDETLAVREELFAARDDVDQRWDELMAQVRQEYAVIGAQAWERLSSDRRAQFTSAEDFIGGFVERIMKRVPTRESVHASFDITWKLQVVPLASAMAEDQASASEILANQQVLSEMKKDHLSDVRKQLEEGIQPFMADLKAKVYGLVYGVTLDVLEATRKNQDKGALPGGSVRQLRNLIQQVDRLNVWDDIQLAGQIAEVSRLLRANATDTATTGMVEKTLQRIGAEALLVLHEVERVPERTGRAMGIPDGVPALESMTGQRKRRQLEPLASVQETVSLARNGRRN